MTTDLYFNYPSTARIRIKKCNVFENDDYKYIYLIITKRLRFFVPKKAIIFNDKYAFIPLEIYRSELNKLYKRIQ